MIRWTSYSQRRHSSRHPRTGCRARLTGWRRRLRTCTCSRLSARSASTRLATQWACARRSSAGTTTRFTRGTDLHLHVAPPSPRGTHLPAGTTTRAASSYATYVATATRGSTSSSRRGSTCVYYANLSSASRRRGWGSQRERTRALRRGACRL